MWIAGSARTETGCSADGCGVRRRPVGKGSWLHEDPRWPGRWRETVPSCVEDPSREGVPSALAERPTTALVVALLLRTGTRVVVRRDHQGVPLDAVGAVERVRTDGQAAWVSLDDRSATEEVHPFSADDAGGRGKYVLVLVENCDLVDARPG